METTSKRILLSSGCKHIQYLHPSLSPLEAVLQCRRGDGAGNTSAPIQSPSTPPPAPSEAPDPPSQLPHKGQGRSLKSTGPPRPASASSRDMMTAMAASSLLGLLDPGSSMMSMLRWELSPGGEEESVREWRGSKAEEKRCVCVRLTHDGLVGVRVAYRVGSAHQPRARQLRCAPVLNLWRSTSTQV